MPITFHDRAPLEKVRRLTDGRLAAVAKFARSGVPDCAWLGYDFGSGVTKDIREISWTSRNGTTADQNPTAGWVESSSNGIDWLARWTFSGLGTWTLGSTQVFSDPALASGSSRRRMVMSW